MRRELATSNNPTLSIFFDLSYGLSKSWIFFITVRTSALGKGILGIQVWVGLGDFDTQVHETAILNVISGTRTFPQEIHMAASLE